MATFDCAENLICATLSGSDGIGVGVVTGTPNKIVVSASNIPNSALANSSININGTTIALGTTGSLAIGDITDVNAGTNLTGGGSSGSVTLSLTSSITGGLDGISGINNIYTNALTATNIQVLGTASVAMLNTVNQQSLQIGDKYIIIMSGAADHVSLSGSGILWGSGSTGSTIGPLGENAYVRYDSGADQLVVYPGLKVSGSLTASNGGFSGDGSNITNISTANITNFNSTVQGLLTGSSNITVTNGTASLNSDVTGLNSVSSTSLTGTNISGTNNLIVGGTVGIGTASPVTKLDVDIATLANTTDASQKWSWQGSNDWGLRLDQVHAGSRIDYGLRIRNGNTSDIDALYFRSDGNVGIGTSSPASYKLQVSGTISGSAIYGLSGSSAQFPNFTNDVRAQFSQGTGIVINNGVISASNIPNSSLQNTGSVIGTTPVILGNTTSSLNGLTNLSSSAISGTNITASIISASVGISSSLGLYTNLTATFVTGTNISGTSAQYTRITGSSITGSTLTYTTISGTFISASQITGSHTGSGAGLYNLTASGISNFTSDVRKQLSGAGIINYDSSTGVISASSGVNSGSSGYIAYYPSPGGSTVDDTTTIYTNGTNVGIGTTTLGSKLTVNGNISGSYLELSTNAAITDPHTNKLYASDITKMWGRIKISSGSNVAPTVTPIEGSNIITATWSSIPAGIIIKSAITLNDSGSFVGQVNFISTSSFDYFTSPEYYVPTFVSRSGTDKMCIVLWDPIAAAEFDPATISDSSKELFIDFTYYQKL